VHRVAVPESAPVGRRQSIVFFHKPNLDAVVDPIGADPAHSVIVGDRLRDKAIRQRAAALEAGR